MQSWTNYPKSYLNVCAPLLGFLGVNNKNKGINMNHYLELIEIERSGVKFYELLLHTGTGVEIYTGSHSHTRLANQAKHISEVLTPLGKPALRIVDTVEMTGSVPLIESYAHMNNGRA